MQGQATDIQIHAKEILRTREVLNGIIAKHSKQPIERVQQDTERDYFLTAEQAKAYGLIDDIIQTPVSGDGLVNPHKEKAEAKT
jgi:ATP-dependent Clp protease protease subunit